MISVRAKRTRKQTQNTTLGATQCLNPIAYVTFHLDSRVVLLIDRLVAIVVAMVDYLAQALGGIVVVGHVELVAEHFGAEEGKQDSVGVYAAHKDANDLAVVVAGLAALARRQREALANGGFNGGRRRRHQVTQLVRGTNHKRAERTRREFHQVNGNHTPSTLHCELLEERGGPDILGAQEGVRVQQGTADNANDNDCQAAADRLADEAADGTASQGAEVGNDLCDGDLCLGEAELVLNHGGVEILAAVAHEVEAGHQQDQVDEQQPVLLERDLAFADEDGADRVFARVAGLRTEALALLVGFRLGQHQTRNDEEHGRACAEPVQRAPAVRGGVDEGARKGCAEEVAKGVLCDMALERLTCNGEGGRLATYTLLKKTTHETASFGRAVFKSSGGGVAV